LTGASSGYHRAELVDQFIRHFSQWWLVGTTANADWGFDMWDLSNQFVAEGVTGGLATFICFIALISMSFGRIGTARKAVEGDRNQEWFLWFLGAALLSHMFAFFGISYFDHTQVAWFALLVMIYVATASRIPHAVKQPETAFADSRLSFPSAQVPNGIHTGKTSHSLGRGTR
jgi:small-conductance mechanosensitive channel